MSMSKVRVVILGLDSLVLFVQNRGSVGII